MERRSERIFGRRYGSSRSVKVTDLNVHLMCVLCGGYYIDATTINECLHSFCRACIVRHLETSSQCPTCNVIVHRAQPVLNIRLDHMLQGLVYKLVPGLLTKEMNNRRNFYLHRTSEQMKSTTESSQSSQQSNEQWEMLFAVPKPVSVNSEALSVSLEYRPKSRIVALSKSAVFDELYAAGAQEISLQLNEFSDVRYLLCPAEFTVGCLKKFIRAKFDLPLIYQINVCHDDEYLQNHFSMLDVAFIFQWQKKAPLPLFYCVTCATRPKRKYLSDKVFKNKDENSERQLNGNTKTDASSSSKSQSAQILSYFQLGRSPKQSCSNSTTDSLASHLKKRSQYHIMRYMKRSKHENLKIFQQKSHLKAKCCCEVDQSLNRTLNKNSTFLDSLEPAAEETFTMKKLQGLRKRCGCLENTGNLGCKIVDEKTKECVKDRNGNGERAAKSKSTGIEKNEILIDLTEENDSLPVHAVAPDIFPSVPSGVASSTVPSVVPSIVARVLTGTVVNGVELVQNQNCPVSNNRIVGNVAFLSTGCTSVIGNSIQDPQNFCQAVANGMTKKSAIAIPCISGINGFRNTFSYGQQSNLRCGVNFCCAVTSPEMTIVPSFGVQFLYSPDAVAMQNSVCGVFQLPETAVPVMSGVVINHRPWIQSDVTSNGIMNDADFQRLCAGEMCNQGNGITQSQCDNHYLVSTLPVHQILEESAMTYSTSLGSVAPVSESCSFAAEGINQTQNNWHNFHMPVNKVRSSWNICESVVDNSVVPLSVTMPGENVLFDENQCLTESIHGSATICSDSLPVSYCHLNLSITSDVVTQTSKPSFAKDCCFGAWDGTLAKFSPFVETTEVPKQNMVNVIVSRCKPKTLYENSDLLDVQLVESKASVLEQTSVSSGVIQLIGEAEQTTVPLDAATDASVPNNQFCDVIEDLKDVGTWKSDASIVEVKSVVKETNVTECKSLSTLKPEECQREKSTNKPANLNLIHEIVCKEYEEIMAPMKTNKVQNQERVDVEMSSNDVGKESYRSITGIEKVIELKDAVTQASELSVVELLKPRKTEGCIRTKKFRCNEAAELKCIENSREETCESLMTDFSGTANATEYLSDLIPSSHIKPMSADRQCRTHVDESIQICITCIPLEEERSALSEMENKTNSETNDDHNSISCSSSSEADNYMQHVTMEGDMNLHQPQFQQPVLPDSFRANFSGSPDTSVADNFSTSLSAVLTSLSVVSDSQEVPSSCCSVEGSNEIYKNDFLILSQHGTNIGEILSRPSSNISNSFTVTEDTAFSARNNEICVETSVPITPQQRDQNFSCSSITEEESFVPREEILPASCLEVVGIGAVSHVAGDSVVSGLGNLSTSSGTLMPSVDASFCFSRSVEGCSLTSSALEIISSCQTVSVIPTEFHYPKTVDNSSVLSCMINSEKIEVKEKEYWTVFQEVKSFPEKVEDAAVKNSSDNSGTYTVKGMVCDSNKDIVDRIGLEETYLEGGQKIVALSELIDSGLPVNFVNKECVPESEKNTMSKMFLNSAGSHSADEIPMLNTAHLQITNFSDSAVAVECLLSSRESLCLKLSDTSKMSSNSENTALLSYENIIPNGAMNSEILLSDAESNVPIFNSVPVTCISASFTDNIETSMFTMSGDLQLPPVHVDQTCSSSVAIEHRTPNFTNNPSADNLSTSEQVAIENSLTMTEVKQQLNGAGEKVLNATKSEFDSADPPNNDSLVTSMLVDYSSVADLSPNVVDVFYDNCLQEDMSVMLTHFVEPEEMPLDSSVSVSSGSGVDQMEGMCVAGIQIAANVNKTAESFIDVPLTPVGDSISMLDTSSDITDSAHVDFFDQNFRSHLANDEWFEYSKTEKDLVIIDNREDSLSVSMKFDDYLPKNTKNDFHHESPNANNPSKEFGVDCKTTLKLQAIDDVVLGSRINLDNVRAVEGDVADKCWLGQPSSCPVQGKDCVNNRCQNVSGIPRSFSFTSCTSSRMTDLIFDRNKIKRRWRSSDNCSYAEGQRKRY